MYPIISGSYAMRGTIQEPHLVNCREFSVTPLEDQALAAIIMDCDGQTSVRELASRYEISIDDLLAFLNKFESAGMIDFSPQQIRRRPFGALGQQPRGLRGVNIDITNRCNLARWCRHCFRGDKLNRSQDVQTADWLRVIEDLSAMGSYSVAFSGGEPTLRRDLPQLVECVLKHKMFFGALFTNGFVWSKNMDAILSMLAESGSKTTLYVSLDGPTAKLHDANRGPGAYQKTVAFIKRLVAFRERCDAKYRLTVNSQVTAENMHTLLSWYDDLKKLDIDRWLISSGRVTGRLAENTGLLPSWDELFVEYEKLICQHIADYRSGPTMLLNMESFFNTSMLNNGYALTFSPVISICDYKEQACSIEPNGDVQFCTSWGSRNFGNVFSTGIRDIWHSDSLQTLKQMKVGQITECQNCDLLQFCGGGCRLVPGDVTKKDPTSCERYRRFVDIILPLLQAAGISFYNERSLQ